MATTRPMTAMQAQALGALRDVGLADAPELARLLLIDDSRARSALASLERRGYVEAQYTGHRFRGRAYRLTGSGRAAYHAEFGDEE